MKLGNSRSADKFVVRLLEGQRDRIQETAHRTRRSMNDFMVYAADLALDGVAKQEALLAALERELSHQQALTAELEAMRAEMAAAGAVSA